MKRYQYLPFIILAGIALFFLGRGCQPEPTHQVNIDTKAIAKRLKAQLSDKATLQGIAAKQTDTVIKWRERWHKAKHDTINIIALCDTVIKHDSILIVTQGEIIDKSDSIITNYQILVRIDSCTIRQLTKDNKKLKRKVILWKVISFVSLGLNGYQAVRD